MRHYTSIETGLIACFIFKQKVMKLLAFMHVVYLGKETTTPPEGQKGETKNYAIFHQPKGADNSPIKVRIKGDFDSLKLEAYKPYVVEFELSDWQMESNGKYRSGVTITAKSVKSDKEAK